MSNSLFDIIKRDAKFIVNSGGYQLDITLSNLDKSQTIDITGWAVKTANFFDTDGNQANTKIAHCTIDEEVLINKGYPVRTFKKGIAEVDLLNHYVSFKDSSGEIITYRVKENHPDENLGLIKLILGDFKQS